MTKTRLIYVIFILSILFVACDNDDSLKISNTGNLSFRIGFVRDSTLKNIYTPSTAIPITNWSTSIKNMEAILTDNNNVIRYAIPIKTSTTKNMDPQTITLTNIPVGRYTLILIANTKESNIVTTGYDGGWNGTNLIGKNLNSLILSLAINPAYKASNNEIPYTGFRLPAEIFSASQSNITIITNTTTTTSIPFSLNRLVALLRVRIDQSKNGNNVVNFMDPQADLRIRKITTAYNMLGGIKSAMNSTNLEYVKGSNVYKNTEPTSGYSKGTILNRAEGITLWSDVIIFPRASTTNENEKLDVVISAMAPIGYTPRDSAKPLTTPTLVYWVGQVDRVITSNSMVEMNCTLNTKGSTSIDSATNQRNLNIRLNIVGWKNIASSTIPM